MSKNSFIIIAVIFVALAASSCEKQLDQLPISYSSVDLAYSSPSGIEAAVAGAYSGIQSAGQYGFNMVYFAEIRSDNTDLEDLTINQGQYGDFETFRLIPQNTTLNDTWVSMYQTIQRCNIVLNRIDAIKGMDETTKTKRKGEMKFIRALTYFNLVRIWGNVPLVTKETDDAFESFNQNRSPVADIYTQIETDLAAAVSALPSAAEATGRATLGAANALLGKVYLTEKKYTQAISALQTVIGKYSLAANFSDVFQDNSVESIFEIQYISGGLGEGSSFSNQFAPKNSGAELKIDGTTGGDNRPTTDLFNAYSNTDTRKAVTIKKVTDGRMYAGKWVVPVAKSGDGDKNSIVLRYADVLLMLSEALNEQGYATTGQAFDLLNMVRTRANMPVYQSGDLPDQNSFRDAVFNERRLELATENHRWFDLVRTGRAVQVMNAYFIASGSISRVDDHQILFPIPQTQIDASGNKILQNAGY